MANQFKKVIKSYTTPLVNSIIINSLNRHLIILAIPLFFAGNLYGQSVAKQKSRFLAGIYHQKNLNIYGFSLGFGSTDDDDRYTNTYGFKIEVPGIGVLLPLFPLGPVAKDSVAFLKLTQKPMYEKIYGFSISATGTMCHCLTNGIAIGGIGQYNFQVNGFSLSLFLNTAQKHNGFQFAATNSSFIMNGIQMGYFNKAHDTNGLQLGLGNFSENTMGVQIGLFNRSKNLKGIQIGLWNVNSKRSLPFINWSF